MPVPLDQALRDHPLLAIPALFGAGLVTSLTPCVYPMIPITAGLLGGASAAERSRSRRFFTLSSTLWVSPWCTRPWVYSRA